MLLMSQQPGFNVPFIFFDMHVRSIIGLNSLALNYSGKLHPVSSFEYPRAIFV